MEQGERLRGEIQELRSRIDRLEVHFQNLEKNIDQRITALEDKIDTFIDWLKSSDERLVTREECRALHQQTADKLANHMEGQENFRRAVWLPLISKGIIWIVGIIGAVYIAMKTGAIK